MAVQKSKKSRSRRGMRRAHQGISNTTALSIDSTTGETHRRHHITAEGYYKGRKVVAVKEDVAATEKDEE